MTYSIYQLDKMCYQTAPLEIMIEARFLIKKYFKQKKKHIIVKLIHSLLYPESKICKEFKFIDIDKYFCLK